MRRKNFKHETKCFDRNRNIRYLMERIIYNLTKKSILSQISDHNIRLRIKNDNIILHYVIIKIIIIKSN